MDEQRGDEQQEQQASLVDRTMRRLASATPARPGTARPALDWRLAATLGGLIALGPLLTIVGAGVLERGARAETARLLARAAPRIAAVAADRSARDLLRGAVRAVPLAVWLDRAAIALPADARLTRMRQADGRQEFDVVAPDPDPVRSAIRRDPAFVGFRERGQRRVGAMILMTYRRAP